MKSPGGSSSAPAQPSPPAGTPINGPGGSPQNVPWTNFLPEGDNMRSAMLGDPSWQSGSMMPAPPPQAAAPQQDMRAMLASLMKAQQMQKRSDMMEVGSRGGPGRGGNYSTSGGGMSTGSYGRTSSGTRSSAHAGGGKWGGR